jgi:hypothetical protein
MTADLVSKLKGDAAMHRHYGRDWSAALIDEAVAEIERLRKKQSDAAPSFPPNFDERNGLT